MKITKKILLLAVFVLIAAPIVLFLNSPAAFWERLVGNPDLGHVNFARLTKTPEPNQYLICPQSVCTLVESDEKAKNYPVDAVTLKLRFIAAVGAENIEIVENSDNILRFIVRTPFFQFPDTVSVAFFPTDNGSTFAIYSRSQIGYSDFGTNEKRVKYWISKLEGLTS